jgi:hypothetical protein
VLLFATWVFLFEKKSSLSFPPSQDEVDPDKKIIAIEKPEKFVPLVYHNSEVGFSFNYVGVEEELTHNPIKPGDKGRMFIDGVNLGKGRVLSMQSQTTDYFLPRGGQLSDATGFKKENGEYFILFNGPDIKVTNADVVPINRGRGEALIVRNTDLEVGEGLYPVHQIAIINNPNKIFPVLVFESLPRTSGRSPNETHKADDSIVSSSKPYLPTEVILLSDEEFLKIISTVTFDDD